MRFTTLPLSIGLLLLCLSPLSAQKRWQTVLKDTTAFNNRYYKQELGLSVQGVFAGYLGGNLIWKVRDDRAKLIPVSFANFWRFQAATNSSTFTGYKDSLSGDGFVLDRTNPASANFYLSGMVGRERVNFFNRFNLYYGWDAGPSYSFQRSNNANEYFIYYNPQTGQNEPRYFNSLVRSHSFGATGAAFFGVKYHFSPRISLSWEAAFWLYYRLVRRRFSINYTDGSSDSSDPVFYHEFGHQFTTLRFITLNYHFKHY